MLIFDRGVLFFTLLFSTLFVYLKAKNEEHRNLLTLGVPYISIGVGALYWIYFLFDSFGSIPGGKASFVMTLWFIIMVWSVDIGAYVVGTNLLQKSAQTKLGPDLLAG